MTEKTILIIDDSATIRRLVDSELSHAGYRVLMAATAEQGVAMAREQMPDLIILDHQLPGTTGYEVCCQLLAQPETARLPVVASSTLRKKAYAEYVDCDNVVDMLPKPYTADVLIATVENAIDTAAMVVQSQNEGSSVPEVINDLGDSDLSGTFGCFGLREVLDLLNNGSKPGVLEVESERGRVFVNVSDGRVQSVTASGIKPEEVAQYMPAALSELTPVIKFTVAGRRGTEVDSLVELLNNKVLDPRLLRKLLRLQAAVLLRMCFTGRLSSFRFVQDSSVSPLLKKLPLDSSLLSLLVEGALICGENELPEFSEDATYIRKAIRGQNLDRAGLSSRHMKLMGLLTKPVVPAQLAKQLNWPVEEVRRVLHGFELAELIERCPAKQQLTCVVCVTSDSQLATKIESSLDSQQDTVSVKVVRDWMALRLLLRRQQPDALIAEVNDPATQSQLTSLMQDTAALQNVRLIGVQSGSCETLPAEFAAEFNTVLNADFTELQLQAAIKTNSPASPASANAQPSALYSEDSNSDATPDCVISS